MSYSPSQLDHKLTNWFVNDLAHTLLRSISLDSGRVRSLTTFNLQINYPLIAIAGRNGSGKSTILAMAACAFHNEKNVIPLINRKVPYYTFSDFFIQLKGEVPPEGVRIIYGIAHNNWKKSPRIPDGTGIAYQHKVKEKNGRWTDYQKRVRRPVVFFGIDRVVPHAEKSVSKSYKSYFQSASKGGWEDEVKISVSRVLGSLYDDFELRRHSKYRLPFVKRTGTSYSGFNMGAGENALFEIFSIMHSCPEGTLIVIDEIELGLHEEAQKQLIDELKALIHKKKIQIICTTHSSAILSRIPLEARYFIENISNRTVITNGISPAYAAGKLSGENSRELDIFVEDDVAKTIVEAALDFGTRSRVTVIPIGSVNALTGQMVARKKAIKSGNAIVIFDGDQRKNIDQILSNFLDMLEEHLDEAEQTEAADWMSERIGFLPGEDWPELMLLRQAKLDPGGKLSDHLGISKEQGLSELIDKAILAGKHNEIYTLANSLHLSEDNTLQRLTTCIVRENPKLFDETIKTVAIGLNEPITEPGVDDLL